MAEIVELKDVRPTRRTMVLVLIARDATKPYLVRLVHRLRRVLLMAMGLTTGTTGKQLMDELGLKADRMASGPEGGDLQIGTMIAAERVDALIYVRDPLTAHPHEPDIQAPLKVCYDDRIPVATDAVSADSLLPYLLDLVREDSARLRGEGP